MGLEASEVAVRVRLLGGTAFQTEAARVAGSVEGINAAGKRSMGGVTGVTNHAHTMLTKTGGSLKKVGREMMGVGRALTMVGIPIAAAGYYSLKASSQFEQAMVLLSTQAGLARGSVAGLSKQVQGMAVQFGATPLSLAQALYPIESIGLRGPRALNALKAAALGSAVGLDSLENTADAVTSIIASHIKGAGGPVEAMATMDQAIGLGKMHLVDLTESFKSGIVPIAQTFGLSFQQILAAASGLTKVGIPANQVMNRMRLTLTSMISPTTMGGKAMAKMNLDQFKLADDLRSKGGLLTALADIKAASAHMSINDRNNAIAQIFGKSRGMASIASLLNQLPSIDKIYNKVMATTPKTLLTHFEQTKETQAFKLKQMSAALQNAMIDFGNVIAKDILPILIHDVLPVIKDLAHWFHDLSPGVKKALVIFSMVVVVGGPLLLFFGAIVSVGGAIVSFLGFLAGGAGLAGLATGVAGAGAAFVTLLPAVAAVAAALLALKVLKDPIYDAGKKVGHGAAHLVTGALAAFGVNGPNDYLNANDYLTSKAYKHLNPLQRADILELIQGPKHGKYTPNGTTWQADLKGVQVPSWLDVPSTSTMPKLAGTNMQPGISTPSGNATGFTVHIPLSLDGRVIRDVVANISRRDLNRR